MAAKNRPDNTTAQGAQQDADLVDTSRGADVPAKAAPRLGELVHVVVPEGAQLINNETGGFFTPGEPTPQTVTLTTLRRLVDGDLALA